VALESKPKDEDPVWNLGDVALSVLIFVAVLLLVAPLIALVIARLTAFRGASVQIIFKSITINMACLVAAYVALLAFMAWIIRQKGHLSFADAIRWNRPGLSGAVSAVAIGVVLGLNAVLVLAVFHRWVPKSTPMDELFTTTKSAYLLAGFATLLAPLLEEMFFRGFLYPALARSTGTWAAIPLTSLGFSLLHGGQLAFAWLPLAMLFSVGLVLTWVRASTKSVARCVLVHMVYNFVLVSLMLIATKGFHNLRP
jgi:hypothetical protein